MQKPSFSAIKAQLAAALAMGANSGVNIDPAGVVSVTQQNRTKKRRAWMPTYKLAGCKGAKSMTVAASKRAAQKRANRRKNPRGCK